jgi:hypothetical protein
MPPNRGFPGFPDDSAASSTGLIKLTADRRTFGFCWFHILADMALITFRSKAAGEIYMFQENARRVFEILGRSDDARGVITPDQLDDAIARLAAAIDDEKAQIKNAAQGGRGPGEDDRAAAQPVTLGQRVVPLLEMLRAAQAKRVDVTWGI